MTTLNEHGETVRGFRVGIRAKGRKMMLPCSGCPLYTGEQALAVMERYAATRPLVETVAITFGEFSGHEVLTLAEMRELYALEMEAA